MIVRVPFITPLTGDILLKGKANLELSKYSAESAKLSNIKFIMVFRIYELFLHYPPPDVSQNWYFQIFQMFLSNSKGWQDASLFPSE